MTNSEFASRCRKYFLDKSFEVGECGENNYSRIVDVHYFTRKQRSGVFKGSDHYFLFVVDDAQFADKTYVEKLHESVRKFVNSRIKTPRALRFSVPNVVSVFFSNKAPDEATVQYIHSIRRPWQGGEVHNAVYIDTASQNVYIHGTTVYNVQGLFDMKLKKVDPSNRSFYQIQDMLNVVLKSS